MSTQAQPNPSSMTGPASSTRGQEKAEMGHEKGQHSVVELVKKDHREAEMFFNDYIKSTDKEQKQMAAWKFIREISIHSAKEESALYPMFVTKLGEKGQQLWDHSLDEHQVLKKELYELDNMKVDDANFESRMHAVYKHLTEHIKEEEEEIMPMLEKAMSKQELVELGDSFISARSMAPTRPHPDAPNKPPALTLAAVAAVPLDMAKDAIRFGTMKNPEKESELKEAERRAAA